MSALIERALEEPLQPKPLKADEIVRTVWPEVIGADRKLLDPQLTKLRKFFLPFEKDLVKTAAGGRGYLLNVVPEVLDSPDTLTAAGVEIVAAKISGLRELAKRLALATEGGDVRPYGRVVLLAHQPLETMDTFARLLVCNTLLGKVDIDIAMPPDPRVIAELATGIMRQLEVVSLAIEKPRDEMLKLLARKMRIAVILPNVTLDSTYVLNADHDHSARVLKYLHQSEALIDEKQGPHAREEGKMIGSWFAEDCDRIIQIHRLVSDRRIVAESIRQALVDRADSHADWLDYFIEPQVPLHFRMPVNF